jgi:hypothetical protein
LPSWSSLLLWVAQNLAWALGAAMFLRLWAWFSSRTFDRRKEIAFWCLVPLFLFGALWIVEVKLRGVTEPRLIATLDKIHIIGISEPDQRDTTVAIVMTIRNTGSPTMADCCHLEITSPDGQAINAQSVQVPETLTLPRVKGGQDPIIYYGSDALYDKLINKAIGTGEIARGILLFHVEGVGPDILARAGTRYRVTFIDVTGETREGTYTLPVKLTYIEGDVPGLRRRPSEGQAH